MGAAHLENKRPLRPITVGTLQGRINKKLDAQRGVARSAVEPLVANLDNRVLRLDRPVRLRRQGDDGLCYLVNIQRGHPRRSRGEWVEIDPMALGLELGVLAPEEATLMRWEKEGKPA